MRGIGDPTTIQSKVVQFTFVHGAKFRLGSHGGKDWPPVPKAIRSAAEQAQPADARVCLIRHVRSFVMHNPHVRYGRSGNTDAVE
jgi:hypothetical protein